MSIFGIKHAAQSTQQCRGDFFKTNRQDVRQSSKRRNERNQKQAFRQRRGLENKLSIKQIFSKQDFRQTSPLSFKQICFLGKSTIQTKKCDRFPFPSFNGCKHGCFLPPGIEKPEPNQRLITLRVRGLCKGVSATATSGEPTALLRLNFSKTAPVPRRKRQITQAKGSGCPTPQAANHASQRRRLSRAASGKSRKLKTAAVPRRKR